LAELGSGNGTSYPGTLDTDNVLEVDSPSASKTKARADVPNDANAAIVAIETELGTDPAGILADVKTFLQTEHNTDGTHNITTSITLAGAAWPSFSANGGSVAQNLANGVAEQIVFGTEVFDTNNDFASNTFTPTVAGKYLLIAHIGSNTIAAGESLSIRIMKGATIIKETMVSGTASSLAYPQVVAVVDANGTTDAYDVDGYFLGAGPINLSTVDEHTYFEGSRIA
jgi:hypothetical protein